jgi:hypothetical protein
LPGSLNHIPVDGKNEIHSAMDTRLAIECWGLLFSTLSGGSLKAVGQAQSPGIGAAAKAECD